MRLRRVRLGHGARVLAVVAAVVSVAALSAGPAITTTAEAAGGGLPALVPVAAGAGQHGYPYDAAPVVPAIAGAPSIDLAAAGYVEHELTMSGTAKTYRQSGFWSSNGRWSAAVDQAAVPYTTRLLVRYPTDPARFNGTVVFEWLNDTTGGDQDPVWAELYQQLVDKGYAYVGVTAQTPGINDLRTWDPQRYGSLGDSNDGQSYDIFTQAAQAVRANSATVLGGLVPRKLIGTGDSQSAFRVDTYVNAVQPLTHAFDAFLAVGRSALAAPIGSGLVATSPFPAQIRTDNTAPFIQLNTAGDIVELDAGVSRQPDNSFLRTWELAGASHIDAHEAAYEIETIAREQPTVAVPHCALGTPIVGTGTVLDGVNQTNNMPLFEVEDAALAALQRWVTTGTPAPHSPQISTTPVFFGLFDTVNVDRFGNSLGGIRLPEIQAPTESYSPINFSQLSASDLNPVSLVSDVTSALQTLSTGSIDNATVRAAGLCLLSGYFVDLPTSTLSGLYPTHAAYVAQYTAAANAAVAAGFLTPEDAGAAIAAAQASTIP
jgi:hypothetical protein